MNTFNRSPEPILKQIEQARVKQGISKADLARKCEITADYYTRIVTDKAPGVAFSIVCRLLEAVNMKMLVYFDTQEVLNSNLK